MIDSPDPSAAEAPRSVTAGTEEMLPVELAILDHYSRRSRCVVNRLPATLGRGDKDDVQLSDPWISHSHCELFQQGGALVVRDLDSKNGVFLHGVRVREAEVLPGECITLGRTEIIVDYGRPAGSGVRGTQAADDSSPATRRPTNGPMTEELLY